MQIRNILAILFILLTATLAIFAWPASNIDILGQKLDWDGLNLATITRDKYKGELQFGESLDLYGGEKYTFSTDLHQESILAEEVPTEQVPADETEGDMATVEDTIASVDYTPQAKDAAEKFGQRLERYGYQDFRLKWSLESESILTIELSISKQTDQDQQIIQLLGSKGQMELWSQDPEYDPEAETAAAEDSFSFFTGMKKIELTEEQITSVNSVYNQKAGGYGFELRFSNDALLPLLIATQTENYRGTMLVVDGQPVATRSAQLENIDQEDSRPVMYMSSLIGESFSTNDAVTAVFETGQLDQQLNLQAIEELEPAIGAGYLNSIKLALLLMFGFLSIVIIYKDNWMGIYQVVYLLVNLVWSLALMKLFGTKLSLSLVSGILLGVLFVLLLNLQFIRSIDVTEKIKILLEKVRAIRNTYRNMYFLALVFVFCAGVIGLFLTDQIFGAFGVISMIALLEIYIFTEIFLPQFVYMQNKSWGNKK